MIESREHPVAHKDRSNKFNDGKLNNWWGYIADMSAYEESR